MIFMASNYNEQLVLIMKEIFYSSLSKQELIQRLILAEKEKIYLLELLELKDQKLKQVQLQNKPESSPTKIQEKPENTTQLSTKVQTNSSTSFFDEAFSQDYYRLQDNGQKAVWLKSSTNNFYADYCHWPSVRSRELITNVKQFMLTMPGYGWIGLGTPNMKNDGFPGYTTDGWMLCTDGRVYHNQAQISSNGSVNFNNKTVSIKVDATSSEISVDGVAVKMGNNIPKSVYFVVSISGSRNPYIEVKS